jgi:hypothetical protein
MVCEALPYAFGSQRRGHPNLAMGLGVHNLNESAGGFVGLATLLWLAPLAWAARKRQRVRWLFGLTLFGLFASYRWPPFDNLLRAIPILNVTDNRRLSLWIALGLSLLGGIGLDHLGATRRSWGGALFPRCWIGLALACMVVAAGIGRFEPKLAAMARAHYDRAANESPGADPAVYRARADRQTRDTLRFIPRYYGLAAAHLIGLAAWAQLVRRRGALPGGALRAGLLGLVLVDLFGFGLGLNPAIDREDDRPVTPLVEYLRGVAAPPARVLGVGEEFPPNVAMRYGLADVRNYDSVELAASVDSFAALYPPGERERTSRRAVTWEGVIRARDRLREAGVTAIIGASPPPAGIFPSVERIGSVWVARTGPGPFVRSAEPLEFDRPTPGTIRYRIFTGESDASEYRTTIEIEEASDGNWVSRSGAGIPPGPSIHALDPGVELPGELDYRPRLVFAAALISIASLCVLFFAAMKADSA